MSSNESTASPSTLDCGLLSNWKNRQSGEVSISSHGHFSRVVRLYRLNVGHVACHGVSAVQMGLGRLPRFNGTNK